MVIWLQWMLLVVIVLLAGFVLNIVLVMFLALFGRLTERFENAAIVGFIFFGLVGYVFGWLRIPSNFHLDPRRPLTLDWFAVFVGLALAVLFSDEVTGLRRLRRFRRLADRLNGWQRAWCLVALVLFLVLIPSTLALMPSEDPDVLADVRDGCQNSSDSTRLSKRYSQFAHNPNTGEFLGFDEAGSQWVSVEPREVPGTIAHRGLLALIAEAKRRSSVDPALIAEAERRLRPCYALSTLVYSHPEIPPIKVEEDYRNVIEHEKANTALLGLGIWAALVGAIYASGLAVAWIRAGFKRTTSR